MYDIRQFKPTLYVVLALGISGFCYAAETPGIWAVAMAGIGVNAWLTWSGRFKPFPRWLANAVTLMAAGFVLVRVLASTGPPLLFIGQFLVLMHLIKLFEQGSNRDYAQLLILSLLLIVAASINTASLLFAVMMMAYLVLVVYCCLIFHLKVEADAARAALAIPADRVSPSTLRQDQRFLPRSMRRLTAVASLMSLTAAVAVFLLFPRGPGQGVLGQMQVRPPNSMTGFSDRISLSQINRIRQNEELVAHVHVWLNERPVAGDPLYLRGLTLDTYAAEAQRGAVRAEWTRSYQGGENREFYDGMAGELEPPLRDAWRQQVMLRPTGTRLMFALPGLEVRSSIIGPLLAFIPSRQITIRHNTDDNSIQAIDPINTPLEYEVISSNAPRTVDGMAKMLTAATRYHTDSNPEVLRQVADYVRQQGLAADLLWARSDPRPVQESNEAIARAFEGHLRGPGFSYTLDLTAQRPMFKGRDPVVVFLQDVRQGHCELFASAMVLMCQSAGVPARMAVGFRCEEYNTIGRYYMVRQSHAHSWVEVLTPGGWVQFDPTSGRDARNHARASLWRSFKHIMDFLEYKWAENVVAFDRKEQADFWTSVDKAATNSLTTLGGWIEDLSLTRLMDRLDQVAAEASFWRIFLDILIILISLMVASIFVAIIWFLLQQKRLKRRAARIGFDGLPVGEQLRLARQLRFYDQLTRALQRHRIVRPRNLTPMEFANSLVFLPAEVYGVVHRLTHLLYRVRFGGKDLPPGRQRRLENIVGRIAAALDDEPFGAGSRAR
jgi:protein-glutamine gamma-glutamyltransferase